MFGTRVFVVWQETSRRKLAEGGYVCLLRTQKSNEPRRLGKPKAAKSVNSVFHNKSKRKGKALAMVLFDGHGQNKCIC